MPRAKKPIKVENIDIDVNLDDGFFINGAKVKGLKVVGISPTVEGNAVLALETADEVLVRVAEVKVDDDESN